MLPCAYTRCQSTEAAISPPQPETEEKVYAPKIQKIVDDISHVDPHHKLKLLICPVDVTIVVIAGVPVSLTPTLIRLPTIHVFIHASAVHVDVLSITTLVAGMHFCLQGSQLVD